MLCKIISKFNDCMGKSDCLRWENVGQNGCHTNIFSDDITEALVIQ